MREKLEPKTGSVTPVDILKMLQLIEEKVQGLQEVLRDAAWAFSSLDPSAEIQLKRDRRWVGSDTCNHKG